MTLERKVRDVVLARGKGLLYCQFIFDGRDVFFFFAFWDGRGDVDTERKAFLDVRNESVFSVVVVYEVDVDSRGINLVVSVPVAAFMQFDRATKDAGIRDMLVGLDEEREDYVGFLSHVDVVFPELLRREHVFDVPPVSNEHAHVLDVVVLEEELDDVTHAYFEAVVLGRESFLLYLVQLRRRDLPTSPTPYSIDGSRAAYGFVARPQNFHVDIAERLGVVVGGLGVACAVDRLETFDAEIVASSYAYYEIYIRLPETHEHEEVNQFPNERKVAGSVGERTARHDDFCVFNLSLHLLERVFLL